MPPFPAGLETAYFALGCFWGAERCFWQVPGVYTTAVGYAGGPTPNPTYEEVCTGRTGHTEIVLVVYDPKTVSYETLLKTFWESHDPTQGMRQGNDVGTQYRSAIYWTTPEQRRLAEASHAAYAQALKQAAYGAITTELARGAAVLLRRGLSSAISRQESRRLLRPRRHRGDLPRRMSGRAAGAAALLVLLWSQAAAAAAVCGATLGASSPQDAALDAFARHVGLRFPAAFRHLADYLHQDGGSALPDCYVTKRAAETRGLAPGA